MKEPHTKIGVGMLIFKDDKVLLGQRIGQWTGAHGDGEYAGPGGHFEYMESIEECARRETREEAGIEIAQIRFSFIANIKKYAPKHYLHIGLLADWKSGEAQVLEPDKCRGWNWYQLDQLPSPLFYASQLTMEAYRTGKQFFDA